jgi:hypothetical protein
MRDMHAHLDVTVLGRHEEGDSIRDLFGKDFEPIISDCSLFLASNVFPGGKRR